MIKIADEDALTLADALAFAFRVINGDLEHIHDSGLAVRLRIKGRGDADVEQEYERLMNLLGYDA